jgi:hypothetical protein
MVDRCGQLAKEALDGRRVVGVEGRATLRRDVGRRLREPLGIAACEDHAGALGARQAGGFEPDAGAATDHDDRLAEQLRLTLGGDAWGRGGHGSSCGGGALHTPSPFARSRLLGEARSGERQSTPAF